MRKLAFLLVSLALVAVIVVVVIQHREIRTLKKQRFNSQITMEMAYSSLISCEEILDLLKTDPTIKRTLPYVRASMEELKSTLLSQPDSSEYSDPRPFCDHTECNKVMNQALMSLYDCQAVLSSPSYTAEQIEVLIIDSRYSMKALQKMLSQHSEE